MLNCVTSLFKKILFMPVLSSLSLLGAHFSSNDPYYAWLAANVGVNQYLVAGPHYGTWAYNSTPYATEGEARVAYALANPPTRELNGDGYADWSGTAQTCGGGGEPHGNLWSNTSALGIGVQLFSYNGESYIPTSGPWQLVIDSISWNYAANGAIASATYCN
jgi:hypothetical protein